MLDVPISAAFGAGTAHIGSVPDWKMTRSKAEKELVVISGLSYRSLGERIVIRLDSVKDRSTVVMISSRPRCPLALADCGKNAENVRRVLEGLRDSLGHGAGA